MKEVEKKILLKDLCARLPYGVIVNYKEGEYDFHKWKIETLYAPEYSESGLLIETNSDGWIGYTDYNGCGMSSASRALHLEKMLPYLRPMSSMTEEEKEDYVSLSNHCVSTSVGFAYLEAQVLVEWLNFHHFDFRHLIERGLALEAPKGMYKTE